MLHSDKRILSSQESSLTAGGLHVDTETKEQTAKETLPASFQFDNPRRRWLWRGAGIAVLLLIAVAVLFVFLRSGAAKYTYSTAAVVRGPLTVLVTATGQLAPVTQVDIGSEVSGTIESVDVDYNARIKAGQVLARINPDKFKAQAAQARAALESAQAKLKETQATVKESQLALWRCSQLHAKDLCSQETLDQSQAAADRASANQGMASADVIRTKAALNAAETDLAKSVIRSPIDGIVLTRAVEPGQTVAAAFQSPVLFTLAQDLVRMELDVDIDEADIGEVHEGQRASFTVDAYPNQTFPATIAQVRYGPRTIQGVVTYQTVLMVDNKDLLLRPGMTATAMIVVQEIKDTVLIPNTALRFQPPTTGKSTSRGLLGNLLPHPPRSFLERPRAPSDSKERDVWTLQDDKLVPVKVQLGASDGSQTQVLSGDLRPGMQIVTDASTKSP